MFSELIKRFKTSAGLGLVPKHFVTNFLWEASEDDYEEDKLKGMLAVRRRPSRV